MVVVEVMGVADETLGSEGHDQPARQAYRGRPRVDASGRTVYDRVSYYRTVPVIPALKGAVGVWQSNFTASSLLTLYAVPTN